MLYFGSKFRWPSGEVNRGTILSDVDASVYRNLDVISHRCFCIVTEALRAPQRAVELRPC